MGDFNDSDFHPDSVTSLSPAGDVAITTCEGQSEDSHATEIPQDNEHPSSDASGSGVSHDLVQGCEHESYHFREATALDALIAELFDASPDGETCETELFEDITTPVQEVSPTGGSAEPKLESAKGLQEPEQEPSTQSDGLQDSCSPGLGSDPPTPAMVCPTIPGHPGDEESITGGRSGSPALSSAPDLTCDGRSSRPSDSSPSGSNAGPVSDALLPPAPADRPIPTTDDCHSPYPTMPPSSIRTKQELASITLTFVSSQGERDYVWQRDRPLKRVIRRACEDLHIDSLLCRFFVDGFRVYNETTINSVCLLPVQIAPLTQI